MRRSLTAVLAADVAGYSRLMNADADGALAALRRLRTEIFGPSVAARRGDVVKNMGDGWIVTFGAVGDAVECAMQVQDRLRIDGGLRLRMGVHLGDVAVADEDVFGEGVNIAARLQSAAAPGALAISGAARDLLDGAKRLAFDDAGRRKLKNIDEPVQVWVRGGELAGRTAELQNAGFPRLIVRPVAAVGGGEAETLAEALTGDLGLYADATRWLDSQVAGAPAEGAYLLEARLRTGAGRARLEATLTDPGGARVAAEKHDGALDDPFAFQDDAATRLAAQTLRWIIAHENRKIDALADEELTAEHWALRALMADGLSDESYGRILDCLSQAMELRPDWGYVHASALAVLTAALMGGHAVVAPYLPQMSDWAAKVDELEPPLSPARVMLALGDHQASGDAAAAGAAAREILRGLPFDPETLLWAGILFIRIGDVREGRGYLEAMERGPDIDIFSRGARFWRALACVMLGEDEEALRLARLTERPGPPFAPLLRLKASVSAHLGRIDDAAAHLAALNACAPGQTVSRVRRALGFEPTPETERYLAGLAKAGMPA